MINYLREIERLYSQIESIYGKNVIALNKSHPPFVANEKPFYGFKGVMLYNQIEGRIQCSACGKWYKAFTGRHLEKDHRKGLWEGKTACDYRKQFGLLKQTGLVSLESKENYSDGNKRKEKYVHMKGNKYWGQRHKGTNRNCPEMANKYGTCEVQLIYKLLLAKKKLGRLPKYWEIPSRNSITRVFGSWKNGLKAARLAQI